MNAVAVEHGNVIRQKLLSHQYDLVRDDDTRIIGMVAGLGSGKTFAVARKAVALMVANPGCDGIMTEPNFPLLSQILIPEFKDALESFGISYKFNRSESVFYCFFGGTVTRVLCKSMENYERLIGVNAAWVIMDEFDTTKMKVAYQAYLKLLGRIRVGVKRQMVIVSTPEGFRAMHRIFVTEAGDNKRLIHAKTTDNKHLPQDYIDTLLSTYPSELIDAYLNGQFVNLTSGTVYRNFSRKTCASDETIQKDDTLHVGQDFNVGDMASVVYVVRGDVWHAVDEITKGLDTPATCDTINQKWPDHRVIVYPDATGKNRTTKGASQSDISILESAGFKIRAHNSNPLVKDRVLSVNTAFSNDRLKVNTKMCPEFTNNLEQQAYNANGEPDKTTGHDHGLDAGGYPIVYTMPISKPVITPQRTPGAH